LLKYLFIFAGQKEWRSFKHGWFDDDHCFSSCFEKQKQKQKQKQKPVAIARIASRWFATTTTGQCAMNFCLFIFIYFIIFQLKAQHERAILNLKMLHGKKKGKTRFQNIFFFSSLRALFFLLGLERQNHQKRYAILQVKKKSKILL
jgi:hypothetical protein